MFHDDFMSNVYVILSCKTNTTLLLACDCDNEGL